MSASSLPHRQRNLVQCCFVWEAGVEGGVVVIQHDQLDRVNIGPFTGTHAYLSNFYRSPVEYDGLMYPTSEHAFQAHKSLDPRVRAYIADVITPREAKRAGRKIKVRSDWERVKVGIMEQIVEAKFRQSIELSFKLAATGGADLVEYNTWRDTYWGVCNGRGRNELGKCLMRVRERLREA